MTGGRWKALAQRIRFEIVELERSVSAVDRHWNLAKTVAEDQNGVERTMELIAFEMDGITLGGEAWHPELLRQMQIELPSVRPALISAEIGQSLDEYRRFRHRVRNIYAANLNPQLIEPLVENLPAIWEQVRKEFLAFAHFLDQLA